MPEHGAAGLARVVHRYPLVALALGAQVAEAGEGQVVARGHQVAALGDGVECLPLLGRLRQHKLKRVTDTDIGRPVTCARFDRTAHGMAGTASVVDSPVNRVQAGAFRQRVTVAHRNLPRILVERRPPKGTVKPTRTSRLSVEATGVMARPNGLAHTKAVLLRYPFA